MLDWHYSVSGANYEVIVLDTRTWRSYHQGHKRPAAMISREGFRRQLPLSGDPGWSAPPGIDGLTLVVAPGPVLDHRVYEDLKETGSHVGLPGQYFGLRHFADVENWRHSLLAFEQLLSRAFRRRSRIVFLSGDVHYGFSMRLAYWASCPYEAAAALAQPIRGVAVQVTSSGLRNCWGPFFSRTGYMRWNALPEPKLFSGWNTAPTVYHLLTQVVRHTPTRTPYVLSEKDLVGVSTKPDWRYRISCVLAETDPNTSFIITAPSSWERQPAQAVYQQALHRYTELAQIHGAGKEIVGENNVGELTFEWYQPPNATPPKMTHRLWWRLSDDLKASPHSVFVIPLAADAEPQDLPTR